MPLLDPAPPWNPPTSTHIVLWHGCTTVDRDAIKAKGVQPTKGRPNTDFVRGFYTTTVKRQARHWAWVRFYDPEFVKQGGFQPVVLRFNVLRADLARRTCISFGAGDYHNTSFWSLLQHCRQSTASIVNDHHGPVVEDGNWYDIACGPVAAFWDQRSAMHDADQVSFHTDDAASLLTVLINSGKKDQYDWEFVT
jgi:Protein of unknown function (DUF3990)